MRRPLGEKGPSGSCNTISSETSVFISRKTHQKKGNSTYINTCLRRWHPFPWSARLQHEHISVRNKCRLRHQPRDDSKPFSWSAHRKRRFHNVTSPRASTRNLMGQAPVWSTPCATCLCVPPRFVGHFRDKWNVMLFAYKALINYLRIGQGSNCPLQGECETTLTA